jgi:hypothetical protein
MQRRISMIARPGSLPDRDWNDSSEAAARLLFTESFAALKFALSAAAPHLDIERVIVDRAGTAADFLHLLSTLPHEFSGDLLLLAVDDEPSYLSALGRGGDRVLYRLNDHDVRFYLETHDLVTGRVFHQRLAS